MNTFKNISRSNENLCTPNTPRRWGLNPTYAVGVVLILSFFIYLSPPALAVSADRDDFIILGRSGEDSELVNENIILRVEPDINSRIKGTLESGASVLVLDKKQVGLETFYLVLTIGQDGGFSGWVSEEYIYQITTEPPRE